MIGNSDDNYMIRCKKKVTTNQKTENKIILTSTPQKWRYSLSLAAVCCLHKRSLYVYIYVYMWICIYIYMWIYIYTYIYYIYISI